MPRMVVSGIWQAPMPWQPTDVAVDSRFRVHVVDPLNGMVHHFGWSGRYLGNTAGVGACRFIAVATDGTLVVAGGSESYRVAGDSVVPLTAPADELQGLLDSVPFAVAADGSMHLGPSCVPPTDEWFDTAGSPATTPVVPTQIYQGTASVIVGPLDSLIDECVWDRITLIGDLPANCVVGVDTLTAQVALSAAELDLVSPDSWATRLVCSSLDAGSWDGLVRSDAGRFLWIRLRLAGSGAATPRIDEAIVDYPRISLRRFLPAVFGVEPTSADFTDRFLANIDRVLRHTEDLIDDVPALLDPHATPYLDWLASWIGVTPDHRLPEALRRDLVADAGHLMDLRGTVVGLRRLLVVALGLDRADDPSARVCSTAGCQPCAPPRQTCPPTPAPTRHRVLPPLVLEHFKLRRWFEAGASRLGDQTVLWGQSIVNRSQLGENAQVGVTGLLGTQDPLRDPFYVYAHKFTVFVPASAGRTPERRKAIEHLVGWGTPAHTLGNVEYVDARMRIGFQSSIGFDTVVARMPAGFTLGQTTLGPASVLDDNDNRSADGSTVGSTTVLR